MMDYVCTESDRWNRRMYDFGVSKYRRWFIFLTVVALLAFVVYAIRAQLQRAVIAASIYHAHIFTPPPPIPNESRWHGLLDSAQFYWDFSEIPFAREKRLKLLEPSLRPIVTEINRRQAAGDNMHYSMHIYREVRWRLNFTPDIRTTRARIADLRQSLMQPAEQNGRQHAGRGGFYAAPSNCKRQRTFCHSRYSGLPDFRTRHGFTQSGYTTRASNFTTTARRASDSAAKIPTAWDRSAGAKFD
jgi:hypothetical protein